MRRDGRCFYIRPRGRGVRRVQRGFGESGGFFAAWGVVKPLGGQSLLEWKMCRICKELKERGKGNYNMLNYLFECESEKSEKCVELDISLHVIIS